MNAELTKKALEKVGNPNVLVNLISRRVRQLNSGAGAISRPLVEAGNLGAADVALLEIIEEKAFQAGGGRHGRNSRPRLTGGIGRHWPIISRECGGGVGG